MSQRSIGLCTDCRARVPAEYYFADGRVWIPQILFALRNEPVAGEFGRRRLAGQTRTMGGHPATNRPPCLLHRDRCASRHHPAILFLDVTNRCNMDCPICWFSLRGMGFDFNPPMEYFEKVFAAVAQMRPRPVVNLFGGEPTVRDDMFEIIEIGRKHGVDTQITTNGLRLADEEYCRKLCAAGVGRG